MPKKKKAARKATPKPRAKKAVAKEVKEVKEAKDVVEVPKEMVAETPIPEPVSPSPEAPTEAAVPESAPEPAPVSRKERLAAERAYRKKHGKPRG